MREIIPQGALVLTIPSSIHSSWLPFFNAQFEQSYIKELFDFITAEQDRGVVVYPPQQLWFKAFEQPLNNIKLTILGQDPYINEGQAMGLSFSVPVGEKIPPSLRNIYKELLSDVAIETPTHGDLSRWAEQESIFLLNASLTVEAGNAGSHLKKGWHRFTLAAIDCINQHNEHCVFLAWGAFAHKCCAKVDETRHCVIKTSHPSPLGAYKIMKTAPAFLGSACFSRVNNYLLSHRQTAINWQVKQ